MASERLTCEACGATRKNSETGNNVLDWVECTACKWITLPAPTPAATTPERDAGVEAAFDFLNERNPHYADEAGPEVFHWMASFAAERTAALEAENAALKAAIGTALHRYDLGMWRDEPTHDALLATR
jgi:transposase